MKNIVPCKICSNDFEYIPGPSGNARQLCKSCKDSVDEEEIKKLEEETITEKIRYLINSSKRKPEFDPLDILVEGNMPSFMTDGDRFVCATEMAYFVKRTGITGLEDNIVRLFELLDLVHIILFIKQQTLQTMESITQDNRFKKFVDKVMFITSEPIKPRLKPILYRTNNMWTCKS